MRHQPAAGRGEAGREQRGRGQQQGDATDLSDELVEHAQHEQRADGEERGTQQGVTPPAAAMQREAGGGEQLHEPKAHDHGHEDTQGPHTRQRADPREHMFAAETHQPGHVHEPIILGPVAAGEFLTRRDAPEAKVFETLGGEAVINKVVVDVAQPIETETQCGPAGPEQHKRRQREKRREGAGREDGTAPQENAEGAQRESPRHRPGEGADGESGLVQYHNTEHGGREARGGREEPRTQNAAAPAAQRQRRPTQHGQEEEKTEGNCES